MQIGPFTVTRDSAIWWLGLVSAVVVALATLDQQTATQTFGLPLSWLPKLRLASFLVGIVSAWAKSSPFPGRQDHPSNVVDIRSRLGE
jgi:hypothetical protein